jgi:isoleucyl-tRNA synthetase
VAGQGSKELEDCYIELIKDEVNVGEVEFVEGKGDLEVKLDTKLTDKLKREGLKREIVRFINNMRKKAKMTIQDRILIYWESASEEIEKSINNYKNDIIKETLANDIKREKIRELHLDKDVNLNGIEVWLGIKKL